MNYAIAEVGGKQYVLTEGKKVIVDKIDQKEGENYSFDKILLVKSAESLLIGTPYVENVKVSGKIVKQYKGEKIDVMKFKAKVRYRRKIGFRPFLTDILVEEIKTSAKIDNREKRV
ncbi:50S ribosomal protein L21 [Candidatus Gottesmanbacteria bacterium RBG_16_37_8]|uniref:Large ribosomal subunit protein bL21 n=1 Tax=Candidatus Gottesmanbacteria bacterium RBG_16_37_8 TaxID=1798371 RepID=A0A1F5YS67_9BACT|nr:MAG: 50S ribosomal protein L21 [Candidatus Gottesmanbacteria bacterium RBG_16_37_8]